MTSKFEIDLHSPSLTHGMSPSGFNIMESSIADIHRALKDKRRTCLDLVNAYSARIAAFDQKRPALHAMLSVSTEAAAIAASKDAQFQAFGALSGALHGISVVVKDNCNTVDMPTTGGSESMEGVMPAIESTVTRKLRDAGAIILGKTNMHEFALAGTTMSLLGGQTRNPYDLTRTPGGASGGSGVAVSANFATAAIGTDTVNSIRSPASANCLVEFRPSRGLISRAGVMSVAETQDAVGPMARTVADAALLLDVLAASMLGILQPSYAKETFPRRIPLISMRTACAARVSVFLKALWGPGHNIWKLTKLWRVQSRQCAMRGRRP